MNLPKVQSKSGMMDFYLGPCHSNPPQLWQHMAQSPDDRVGTIILILQKKGIKEVQN